MFNSTWNVFLNNLFQVFFSSHIHVLICVIAEDDVASVLVSTVLMRFRDFVDPLLITLCRPSFQESKICKFFCWYKIYFPTCQHLLPHRRCTWYLTHQPNHSKFLYFSRHSSLRRFSAWSTAVIVACFEQPTPSDHNPSEKSLHFHSFENYPPTKSFAVIQLFKAVGSIL